MSYIVTIQNDTGQQIFNVAVNKEDIKYMSDGKLIIETDNKIK